MVDVSAPQLINTKNQHPIYWGGPNVCQGLPDPRGSYSGSFYANTHERYNKETSYEKVLGHINKTAGQAEYIDYGAMNTQNTQNYGNGGLIIDTHGTMYGGAVPELGMIPHSVMSSTIFEPREVIPRQLKELPPIYEGDIKKALKHNPYLKNSVINNAPNLKASDGVFEYAPIDYSLIMSQPENTKQYIIGNSSGDVALVNALLRNKQQRIPNLEKIIFDVFGKKMEKENISEKIQEVLDEVIGPEQERGTMDQIEAGPQQMEPPNMGQPQGQPDIGQPEGQPEPTQGEEGKFPNKFPDEKHAYSYKNKGWYQFLGPGTHITERMNDEPINGIDYSAKIHDIEYQAMYTRMKRGETITKEEVRNSDLELIENIEQELNDEPVVGNVALMVMRNKIRLEDAGMMDYMRFINDYKGLM